MSKVINQRQIATLLTALRYWQDNGMAQPSIIPYDADGFSNDASTTELLTAEEITTLCNALSTNTFRGESYHPKVAILHDAGELGILCDPEVQIERIATDDAIGLIGERREELLNVLGEEFEHLRNI